MKEARRYLPDTVNYVDNIYEIFIDADAVVLMTEWNAYRGLDMDRLKTSMRGNVFIDLRNVYEPGQMLSAGFNYVSVGRSGKVE